MNYRFLYTSLLGIIFTFLYAPPLLASFIVTPMEFHLTLNQSQSSINSFSIHNRSTTPLRFKLYVNDFKLNPDGSEEFLDAGTTPHSSGTWIALSAEEIELEPGESRSVRFSLNLPPETIGSHWSMIFIEQVSNPRVENQKKGKVNFGIQAFQRMGIRVYNRTPNPPPNQGEITNIEISKNPKTNNNDILVHFKNSGTTILRKCKPSVDLFYKGEKIKTLKQPPLNSYPGITRVIRIPLMENLAPGPYTALAVVDDGNRELVAGEKQFIIQKAPTS